MKASVQCHDDDVVDTVLTEDDCDNTADDDDVEALLVTAPPLSLQSMLEISFSSELLSLDIDSLLGNTASTLLPLSLQYGKRNTEIIINLSNEFV